MPGFFGFISDEKKVIEKNIDMYTIVDQQNQFLDEEALIDTGALYGRFFRHAVNKFEKDKSFDQDEKSFFILDGVILNKNSLMEKYGFNQNDEITPLLKKMVLSSSEDFFNAFRGSFAGAVLNKKNSEFTLYTNHIGDKTIFYHVVKETNTLYFSTDFESLIKMIQVHIGKKFNVNVNAAYSLMSHGYTLCNETLLEDVYRLTPGHYLYYASNTIIKKQYYKLKNTPIQITEEEAIKKIDTHFRNVIKMEFEKDIEYGYRHLVSLSGGLDSRMTTWVAHELGYINMLNYTFCQSGYLDETIPQKIAACLNNEWIFKTLDNGIYLYKYFEEAVRISDARCQSSTVSHTLSMLSNLNMDHFGLVHTGQLGGSVLGSYYTEGKKQSFQPGAGANSLKLISRVHYSTDNAFNIDDQELFKFYNRGFTGNNTGLKPMYQYTETISAFLDADFLDICLSLPLEYRKGRSIYMKWISQYYPGAAEFVYDKVNGKINKKMFMVKGVLIPWSSIPTAANKFIKMKLGLKLKSKNHMNPIDFWYKKNSNLRKFYDSQFERNIDFVGDSVLKNDCQELFKTGTTQEKDQVITFLRFLNEMQNYIS